MRHDVPKSIIRLRSMLLWTAGTAAAQMGSLCFGIRQAYTEDLVRCCCKAPKRMPSPRKCPNMEYIGILYRDLQSWFLGDTSYLGTWPLRNDEDRFLSSGAVQRRGMAVVHEEDSGLTRRQVVSIYGNFYYTQVLGSRAHIWLISRVYGDAMIPEEHVTVRCCINHLEPRVCM